MLITLTVNYKSKGPQVLQAARSAAEWHKPNAAISQQETANRITKKFTNFIFHFRHKEDLSDVK